MEKRSGKGLKGSVVGWGSGEGLKASLEGQGSLPKEKEPPELSAPNKTGPAVLSCGGRELQSRAASDGGTGRCCSPATSGS